MEKYLAFNDLTRVSVSCNIHCSKYKVRRAAVHISNKHFRIIVTVDFFPTFVDILANYVSGEIFTFDYTNTRQ